MSPVQHLYRSRHQRTGVPEWHLQRVLSQIKPYLGYFAIDQMRSIFNSNYNSLQVKATKRFKGKTLYRRQLSLGRGV